jgi:hypothetical protein
MNPTEVTLAQYFAASALPATIAEGVRMRTHPQQVVWEAYDYGRRLAELYEKRPALKSVPDSEP